jgi:fatty acid desaturase
MSKMLWLAFGAAAAILLCLYYFGGVWTAALLVVMVVVFLGWKFVAPHFGLASEQSEAKRKAAEEE